MNGLFSHKIIISFIVVIIGIITFSFGLKFFTNPTKEYNELIVGLNTSFPPYEFIDEDGQIIGYDVDVATQIAKKLNKKLVIKDMGFDALIVALKQGKIDLILAGMEITPERSKEIVMVPYGSIDSFALLFWQKIPNQITKIHDIANLPNKQVCTQAGTTYENYLKKIPEIEIKTIDDITEVVIDLGIRKKK